MQRIALQDGADSIVITDSLFRDSGQLRQIALRWQIFVLPVGMWHPVHIHTYIHICRYGSQTHMPIPTRSI